MPCSQNRHGSAHARFCEEWTAAGAHLCEAGASRMVPGNCSSWACSAAMALNVTATLLSTFMPTPSGGCRAMNNNIGICV